MCEAIAQVGAIAVLTDPRFAGKLPLFGGLDGARFRRQVEPGDTLELHVELQRMSARAGKGSGQRSAARRDRLRVRADVRAGRPLTGQRRLPRHSGAATRVQCSHGVPRSTRSASAINPWRKATSSTTSGSSHGPPNH